MGVTFSSFPAFGGQAMVGVTLEGSLERACEVVLQTVAEYDRACSRFRSDSELTMLNRRSGEQVAVGETLFDAVETAVAAARLTEGDVDPTVGAALVALGYDQDFASLRPGRPVTLAAVAGWQRVELDRTRRTVRIPEGAQVDLGATAKALAADRACDRARKAVGEGVGVLVSFSGDIATAGAPPAEGWRIRVTDDHRSGADAPGQWIQLFTGGLATSSTTARRWQTAGGDVHHVINPRTGGPTRGPWRTVSVTAASCLEANVASTATLVRGNAAASWLEALELPARLVDQQGHALHLAGWPAAGDDLG